jgi:cytochrome c oxidase subunit III
VNPSRSEQADRTAMTGVLAALAATTMLFAAMVSAYIVRRGISSDWAGISLPALAYFSVAPGAVVSVGVELARRNGGRLPLLGAIASAIVFLLMMSAGVWSTTVQGKSSTAAAFIAVINGMVSVYAVGGIAALLGGLRNLRLAATACYWHYLNALWILLLALFYLWP